MSRSFQIGLFFVSELCHVKNSESLHLTNLEFSWCVELVGEGSSLEVELSEEEPTEEFAESSKNLEEHTEDEEEESPEVMKTQKLSL